MSEQQDKIQRGFATVRAGMRPRAQMDITTVATLIQAAATNMCGGCHEPILEFWCYCPQCGTEVDWDSESGGDKTAQGSKGSG